MRLDITLALLVVYLFLPNRPSFVRCSDGGKPNETDQSVTSNPAENSSSKLSEDTQSSSQANGTQSGSTPPASPTGGTNEPTKAETVDMSNKTGVTLDIKNHKKPTDQFDHSKSNKIVTYTAKGENAFNVVKHKDLTIWSTNNKSEYASKVILDGRGKKEKSVSIHLFSGTVKVYNRPGQGEQWSEDTNPSQPATDKSKTDSGTTSNGFELNMKEADTSGNEKYDLQVGYPSISIYTFKSNVKCTLIKCEDKEVWKYETNKYGGKHPKSVNYYKKDKVSIQFDEGTLVYKKDNDAWKKDDGDSTLKDTSSNDANAKSGTGGRTAGTGGGGTGQQGGNQASGGGGTTGGGTQGSGQGGEGSANGTSGTNEKSNEKSRSGTTH